MSSSELAVSARGLSKSYTIAHQGEKHVTLAESLLAKVRRPFAREPKETFWALRDITLHIKKSEVVGIIGRNGAGKSTLLKIMSRITEPTTGEINLYGRVGSLLEVGTGFHPELTGRENIFLNGAILGMTKAEIRKQFDAIVDFAGVEKFLDTPVKRYSSGMYVRLAFAVAAYLNPEILIVDEVLAVGDAHFQKKCIGKMQQASREEGRTVIFVSHNMPALTNLCSRAVLLTDGRVTLDGSVTEVVSRYIAMGQEALGEVSWSDPLKAPGNQRLRLHAVRVISDCEVTGDVEIHRDVNIEIQYWNYVRHSNVCVSFHVYHQSGVCVLATGNAQSSHEPGLFRASGTIPRDFLNDGIYSINVFLILDVTNIQVQAPDAISFRVHDSGVSRGEYLGEICGVVRPLLKWEGGEQIGDLEPSLQEDQ